MKRALLLFAVVAMFVTGVVVRAEEPTSKPAKEVHKRTGVVQPWSLITDLTDDEKTQIADIHKKATADKDAIDAKEKADILALLTDAQKKELDDAVAKKKADMEAEHQKREADKKATTQPAGEAK